MPTSVSKILTESGPDLRRRLLAVYGVLIAGNIVIWLWALVVLEARPVLLGTALLAYTFGLRHAVDADHIAAIDNVTRKLMQQGQRPVGVGFFFSLGHSAVVVLMSIGVAFAGAALTSRFNSFKEVGGVISTSVSALFLFAIAIFSIIVPTLGREAAAGEAGSKSFWRFGFASFRPVVAPSMILPPNAASPAARYPRFDPVRETPPFRLSRRSPEISVFPSGASSESRMMSSGDRSSASGLSIARSKRT